MVPTSTQTPHRVVIAGGGVAGLEALLALRALAGEYVAVTLIEPRPTFALRALGVQDPFAPGPTLQYDLQRICTEQHATLVADRLESVDVERRVVRTASGDEEPFDSLLLALGARPAPVYEQAMTFRGATDAEAMRAVLRDIEHGTVGRVAFVVPAGITWTLPLYELALMTAERSRALGIDDLTLTIVTPEESALHVFGREASDGVAAALADAGVDLLTRTYTEAISGDGLVMVHTRLGEDPLLADRVVALPRLDGPAPQGIPCDSAGFLSADQNGRVRAVEGVFAAGDGTDFAVKQGGLAAQQADAAAHAIAERAGVEVDPLPFRPVLRGRLFSGSGSQYLREVLTGGDGDATSRIEPHALWWPASKVAAPYLAPYLERLDLREDGFAPSHPPAGDADVEVLGRLPAPPRVGGSQAGSTHARGFARELPRERWHEELDRLTLERLHARTLVEVEGGDPGAGVGSRGLLLLAVGYDARDDVFEVAVTHPHPDGEEVFRHLVDRPARILVDSSEGIVPAALAVDDVAGHRTVVHLVADPAFAG